MSHQKKSNAFLWFATAVITLIVLALIYISQLQTGPKADTYNVNTPTTEVGKTNPDPLS